MLIAVASIWVEGHSAEDFQCGVRELASHMILVLPSPRRLVCSIKIPKHRRQKNPGRNVRFAPRVSRNQLGSRTVERRKELFCRILCGMQMEKGAFRVGKRAKLPQFTP
jgi:hypothetical protein